MTPPRILVISTAELGAQMLGVGIRSFEIARSLASVGSVTLAGVGEPGAGEHDLPIVAYNHENPIALRAAIRAADVVVAQPQPPLITYGHGLS